MGGWRRSKYPLVSLHNGCSLLGGGGDGVRAGAGGGRGAAAPARSAAAGARAGGDGGGGAAGLARWRDRGVEGAGGVDRPVLAAAVPAGRAGGAGRRAAVR